MMKLMARESKITEADEENTSSRDSDTNTDDPNEDQSNELVKLTNEVMAHYEESMQNVMM